MDICRTATSYDTFLYSSLSSVECVFDSQLSFFQFSFCCSSNLDDSNTASQLSQSFLCLFSVEFGVRCFDLSSDLSNSVCNIFSLAGTIYDNSIFFVNFDSSGTTQHIHCSFLQFISQIFRNYSSASQNCDIIQISLSSFAESRSLDSYTFECALQLVHDDRCQCFAFQVIADDEQLSALLYDLFQNRQDLLNVIDLLVSDEDIRILQYSFHLFCISYHVRGEVSSVELHTFYDFQRSTHSLGFFHRDNAVLADLFHCFCDQSTDRIISSGYGSNLCDAVLAVNVLSQSLDFIHSYIYCTLDPSLEYHRISTCSYIFKSFFDNDLRQQSCSCCSVTGNIVCLGSYFLNNLCAHVLYCIFQFDLSCDRNTIVSDQRGSELLVDQYVSSLWS